MIFIKKPKPPSKKKLYPIFQIPILAFSQKIHRSYYNKNTILTKVFKIYIQEHAKKVRLGQQKMSSNLVWTMIQTGRPSHNFQNFIKISYKMRFPKPVSVKKKTKIIYKPQEILHDENSSIISKCRMSTNYPAIVELHYRRQFQY